MFCVVCVYCVQLVLALIWQWVTKEYPKIPLRSDSWWFSFDPYPFVALASRLQLPCKFLMLSDSGGFGADFTSNSLLAQYRPDLLHLPTTNGEHCTGDGIKMGEAGFAWWRSLMPSPGGGLVGGSFLKCTALRGHWCEEHRLGVGPGAPHRPRQAG